MSSNEDTEPLDVLKMDQPCLRIAYCLFRDTDFRGTTRRKLASDSKMSTRTVTEHWLHLENRSLVTRERVRLNALGSRNWLYKPTVKLMEMKSAVDSAFSVENGIRGIDVRLRPSIQSAEFIERFNKAVEESANPGEAAKKLGYAHYNQLYAVMKKLGLRSPQKWSEIRTSLGLRKMEEVPKVVIENRDDRNFVAGLVVGEGSIGASFVRYDNSMTLFLAVGMTDSRTISRLSKCYQLEPPSRPLPRKDDGRKIKPVWKKTINGLRAYRVLQEILPFMSGPKVEEAQKALEFFAPVGHHPGHLRSTDIWPYDKFPFRDRGRR